jgi:hypothetical protein
MIVIQLIGNIQNDKKAGSKATCKAKDVDSRKAFIFQQISKGRFKIIFEHLISFIGDCYI